MEHASFRHAAGEAEQDTPEQQLSAGFGQMPEVKVQKSHITELRCRRCGRAGITLAGHDPTYMVHYSQTVGGDEVISIDETHKPCSGPCCVARYSGDITEADEVRLDRMEISGIIESALALGWQGPGEEVRAESVSLFAFAYADRDGFNGVVTDERTYDDEEVAAIATAYARLVERWLIDLGFVNHDGAN